jgi:2-methylaconitate cis-trans-isomerase PrpF
MNDAARAAPVLRIGHPGGIIDIEKQCRLTADGPIIEKLAVGRTARKLMEGVVYIKMSVIAK